MRCRYRDRPKLLALVAALPLGVAGEQPDLAGERHELKIAARRCHGIAHLYARAAQEAYLKQSPGGLEVDDKPRQ